MSEKGFMIVTGTLEGTFITQGSFIERVESVTKCTINTDLTIAKGAIVCFEKRFARVVDVDELGTLAVYEFATGSRCGWCHTYVKRATPEEYTQSLFKIGDVVKTQFHNVPLDYMVARHAINDVMTDRFFEVTQIGALGEVQVRRDDNKRMLYSPHQLYKVDPPKKEEPPKAVETKTEEELNVGDYVVCLHGGYKGQPAKVTSLNNCVLIQTANGPSIVTQKEYVVKLEGPQIIGEMVTLMQK